MNYDYVELQIFINIKDNNYEKKFFALTANRF
jgi:hypothetical protein